MHSSYYQRFKQKILKIITIFKSNTLHTINDIILLQVILNKVCKFGEFHMET